MFDNHFCEYERNERNCVLFSDPRCPDHCAYIEKYGHHCEYEHEDTICLLFSDPECPNHSVYILKYGNNPSYGTVPSSET